MPVLAVAAASAGCGRDTLGNHPVFEPDINVDPLTIGFGGELLGVRAVRTATISNVGNSQLAIQSINLVEDDGVLEFTAVPTGDVVLAVAAGASTEVQLTLTNRDGLADSGRLVIASDDPDEAVVEVTLVGEIKGDVTLGTCVMTTPTLMEACAADPETIDFGTLPYDAVAVQDVAIFNAGNGNKPLRVDDVFVSNSTGNSGLFRLDFFRMVEDASTPGTYIEEEIFDFPTAPYWLSVDNGLDGPEVLIARVTFSAGLDGQPVPAENLVIESDDPVDSSHEIPFAGDIGCPPGSYDYDSQPGCEYGCDPTNGGVEICDGLDNDCNGQIDDGVSPGLCLMCDSTGNPAVGVDDTACGSIDCSSWYTKSGIASVSGTDACYAHEPITANRCEGWEDCKDPNTLDCGATALAATPVLSCATCQYVDGCDGATPGTCANYAAGTPTSLCVGCDGTGGEGPIADDPACGAIDCSGWYAREGTEGPGTTNSCHGREPITVDRCEGAGDCKDADTGDCDSQPTSLTPLVTCGICQRVIGCIGSIPGLCESYLPGTPTGLCSACDAAGGETMPLDDAGCGPIDCSGWYSSAGSGGPTGIESCYARENITANRCEGFGDCLDANTADCIPSPWAAAPQVTCGTCQYLSGCNATLAGTCTDYPPGTVTSGTCGTGVCQRDFACDGSGSESCTPGPPTGSDNDCDGLDDNCNGQADENYASYTCGVGVCQRSSTCVAGGESCSMGTPQPTDDPDDLFIDSNCDGIDGDASIGIFVAVDGNDTTGNGSSALPFRTIQKGIDVAVNGQHVYVSEGTYNQVVTLKNGVSVYGGYSRANAWNRGWGYVVTISASSATAGRMIGVRGFNLTSAAVIADMTIGTANASVAGMSNYGMYCSNCDGLTLRGLTIVAGSGFVGANGSDGTDGAPGGNGSDGTNGSCDGANGWGGARGGSACFRYGGYGGRGGGEGCNDGSAGTSGVSSVSGGGGGAHCDGGCCSGCTATGGGNGTNGGSGASGVNGGGASGGFVSAGYWLTYGGGNGTNGTHGNGGGGGGGGGGQCGWAVNNGGGDGGGGGGAGGCRGTLGTGGGGGGGSFGLFLVGSTGILLLGNTITANDGGGGGDAGVGGAGGLGGNRGLGGRSCPSEVGPGGNGGWGGNGGNGGNGGGGAGGPSYSVYRSGTTVSLSGNVLSFGNGGAGGWSAVNGGFAGATGQTN